MLAKNWLCKKSDKEMKSTSRISQTSSIFSFTYQCRSLIPTMTPAISTMFSLPTPKVLLPTFQNIKVESFTECSTCFGSKFRKSSVESRMHIVISMSILIIELVLMNFKRVWTILELNIKSMKLIWSFSILIEIIKATLHTKTSANSPTNAEEISTLVSTEKVSKMNKRTSSKLNLGWNTIWTTLTCMISKRWVKHCLSKVNKSTLIEDRKTLWLLFLKRLRMMKNLDTVKRLIFLETKE